MIRRIAGFLAFATLTSFWIPFLGESLCADLDARIPKNAQSKSKAADAVPTARIANTLQKLNKNLVLESTRGEKDIALFQKAAPAVVFVLAGTDSVGSGAIISADGKVITNWHVVGANLRVIVVLKPKDSAELKKELAFSATVEKVDQIADLALLRITSPPRSLSFLTLGTASSLSIGQDVHAIGHPQGEVWTYTRGLISQIRANYEWKTESGLAHHANVIQTQTPINPGNSGGPLLDDGAKLIGINSFKAGGEGLNYAVSVDAIGEFLAREGNRQAAQSQSQTTRGPRCTEGYDTMRRGWNDIIGCYQDSVSPPPDVWFVFRTRDKNPIYIAMDSDTSGKVGKIDLIRKNVGSDWKIAEAYVDADCDGTVDVIEKYIDGERVSSRLPPPNLRVISLAKEINTALNNGRIPYRELRVCQ